MQQSVGNNPAAAAAAAAVAQSQQRAVALQQQQVTSPFDAFIEVKLELKSLTVVLLLVPKTILKTYVFDFLICSWI